MNLTDVRLRSGGRQITWQSRAADKHPASGWARNRSCGAGLALRPKRFDFARERAVNLVYQLGMPDQDSHVPGDFDPALQSRVDEIDLSSRDLFEYRRGKLEDELEILARRWRVGLPILETFAVREQHHEVAQLADREIERARIADNLRQHVEGATRGIFIDFRIFVEELFDSLVPFGRVNRRHDNPLAADPVPLIEPIFLLPQLGQAV